MLAKLPDPKGYQTFKPTSPVIVFEDNSKYNIKDQVKYFKLGDNKNIIYFELVEMFGYKFIGQFDYLHNKTLKDVETNQVKLKSYMKHYKDNLGILHTYSSLAVELYDDNQELKTATIRRYRTKSGDEVKWYKIRGSKAGFIPYRLNETSSYCFVAFGIAEALIFNILGLDYFILQSDSGAYRISSNPYFKAVKEKIKGREVWILPDYDESCFNAAKTLQEYLKGFCNPSIIEFFQLVDNPKKGYDFRDYVLEIQDKNIIIENLLNLI